ncbi:MAG: LCP family protein [Lachnospiraceae bacterium]|nr:LCP family protein [Lachnospiraceae bacterium]
MENENKDMELEPQGTETEVNEFDFDPTESEEFYSNLEAAIGDVEVAEPAEASNLETEETPEAGEATEASETVVVAPPEEEQSTEYSEGEEDFLFAGVDAALAVQIEQEFGKDVEEAGTVEEETAGKEKKPNKFMAFLKEIPTWTKVLVSVILVILLSVGLLFGTPGGRNLVVKAITSVFFANIKEDPDDLGYISPIPELIDTPTPEPTMDPNQNPDATPEPTMDPGQNPDATPGLSGEPSLTPEPTATPKPPVTIMDDEDVINVLLLGEENIYGAKRGRTDAILLVSIDLNGGPLKIVSFQRDLYVSIKGYEDDRLNASYAYGGASLIMDTIEKNFGVDIDSYVKVNFEGFENIIDQLGGLEISLTAKESEYLNTTKYISKPSQRNTVAGTQTMTGSQVLGYCRVRYVPTAEGLRDDRGRNYRHRVVLQAIFNKFKEKSFSELVTIMGQCFSYVSAPADLEDLAVDCLSAVIENRMFEIDTMQVPQSGKFTNATIAKKDVIVFYPECVDMLQDFLYGEE